MPLPPAVCDDIKYRGVPDDHDDLMDVPIYRFHSLDALKFDLEQPARYFVTDSDFSLPLDFLFVPRDRDRLLVGFHGAENYAPDKFPKYQFVRSFMTRNESLLFPFDTTLLQSARINIGWMAGNQDTPLAALYSTVVRLAGLALGADQTVLVGHSAGGFAAMRVGARVQNSRAISVNGQVVVGCHRPWLISKLHKHVFPEAASTTEMLQRYQSRLDLRVVLEKRAPGSTFTYYGHRDDALSMTDHPHVPLLADHVAVDPSEGGRTEAGDAVVVCDWESDNPNRHALPGSVLPFLQLTLGEPSDRSISPSQNPIWHVLA